MSTPSTRTLARALCAALVPCLVAAGCGGGNKTTSTASNPAAAPATNNTAVAARASVRRRLRILSPAAGAHTGTAVTVRVRVSGGPLHGGHAIRYVLDGALSRTGATQLTFREVAPGRHHLVVLLAGEPGVRASRSFTVVAPAPVAQPASAEPMQAHTEAPAAAAPPKAPEPQPERTTTEHTSTEHASTEHANTEHASPPPSGEGAIPQGGGGDGDGDNSGGPSDGDGNV